MFNKVLLLDDNKATNFIHTKFLKQSDACNEIVSFLTGKDALEHLKDKDSVFPDLIISDINMPTMDVWEFLDLYNTIERSVKTNPKIILLTTSLSPEDNERIKAYPMVSQIINKPLDKRAIQNLIEKFIKGEDSQQ
ncbi:response regulator [Croceivirga radicis]|uniref:response regulator n=1 Tax=Croceivirga radicis TaxID=1929488 RepID=UPI000255B350|nr:response regulator [Croceivirga radicis]